VDPDARPARVVYPFDVPLLLFAAAAYACSVAVGFPVSWRAVVDLRFDLAIIQSLVYYVPIFLLVRYARRRAAREDRSAAAVIRELARQLGARLRDWRAYYEVFRLVLAIKVLFLVHANLKARIYMINPRLYDLPLWELDRWLHLGWDPARDLPRSAAGAAIAPLIDFLYVVWYPVKIAGLAFFVFFAERRRAWHFMTAFVLLWAVGDALAILFPSLGPCYVDPALYRELGAPYAHELQAGLWRAYMETRTQPVGPAIYEGVAAFPSLHVGVVVLFSAFAWRNAVVFVPMAAFTLAVLLGSVLLGWHYAVDGYASAAVALAAYFGTRPLFAEPAPDEDDGDDGDDGGGVEDAAGPDGAGSPTPG